MSASDAPLVSIIMNCLNCEQYLKEAIGSIYAQGYENWEIIFWDNASCDSSAEIANSFDGRLRYFRGEETIPLGAARNKAIGKARGEYIAFLDCDDLWLPEKLEKQVDFLQTRPEIDFLYSNAYVLQGEQKTLMCSRQAEMPQGSVFRAFLTQYPVNMQTVIFRKSILDSIDHWFDEKLELCEEYDFFMRLLYNTQASYHKEPLVVYRVHPGMTTVKKFHKFDYERLCILEKFTRNISGFAQRYQGEIRWYRAKIALGQATEYVLQGKRSQARKALLPFTFISFKHFASYLMTFMPLFLYVMIREVRGGGVIRQRLRHIGKGGVDE